MKTSRGRATSPPQDINDWISALQLQDRQPEKAAGASWQALCPAHDDHNPSLSLTRGHTQGVLVKCHAGCTFEEVRDALWQPQGDHYAVRPRPHITSSKRKRTRSRSRSPRSDGTTTYYKYESPAGDTLFRIERTDYAAGGGKDIRQQVPDPSQPTGWRGQGFSEPKPPYRLPEVLAQPEKPILVVEGESCVHVAQEALPSHVVTTWAGGTVAVTATDWTPLQGRNVTLISDGDSPGRTAMLTLAQHLYEMSAQVQVYLTAGEAKDDIADWLHEDAAAALARVALAEEYRPDLIGAAGNQSSGDTTIKAASQHLRPDNVHRSLEQRVHRGEDLDTTAVGEAFAAYVQDILVWDERSVVWRYKPPERCLFYADRPYAVYSGTHWDVADWRNFAALYYLHEFRRTVRAWAADALAVAWKNEQVAQQKMLHKFVRSVSAASWGSPTVRTTVQGVTQKLVTRRFETYTPHYWNLQNGVLDTTNGVLHRRSTARSVPGPQLWNEWTWTLPGRLDPYTGPPAQPLPVRTAMGRHLATFSRPAYWAAWCRMLDRWLPDRAVQEHLQVLLGGCMSGQLDRRFLWLHGPTNAGKSTFVDCLAQAFAPITTVMEEKDVVTHQLNRPTHAGSVKDILARGARLWLYPGECNRLHLDSGLLKALTGRDRLRARGSGDGSGQESEGIPIGIPLLSSNDHTPKMRMDQALLARMRIIPFLQTIGRAEGEAWRRQYQVLREDNRFHASVIAWVAMGSIRYRVEGEGSIPAAVYEANRAVVEQIDPLQHWLTSAEITALSPTTFPELSTRWEARREDQDAPPIANKVMGRKLRDAGWVRGLRTSKGFLWAWPPDPDAAPPQPTRLQVGSDQPALAPTLSALQGVYTEES